MVYTIEALSLAARNLKKMAGFYARVFGIRFKTVKLGRGKLYLGRWDGKEFALYAGDRNQKAAFNPQHMEIFFPNLGKAIQVVKRNGGKTNGEPREDDTVRAVGVFDPDGNFFVFKQRLRARRRR